MHLISKFNLGKLYCLLQTFSLENKSAESDQNCLIFGKFMRRITVDVLLNFEH